MIVKRSGRPKDERPHQRMVQFRTISNCNREILQKPRWLENFVQRICTLFKRISTTHLDLESSLNLFCITLNIGCMLFTCLSMYSQSCFPKYYITAHYFPLHIQISGTNFGLFFPPELLLFACASSRERVQHNQQTNKNSARNQTIRSFVRFKCCLRASAIFSIVCVCVFLWGICIIICCGDAVVLVFAEVLKLI